MRRPGRAMSVNTHKAVTPAKAGVQTVAVPGADADWAPAIAGVTVMCKASKR